MAYRKSYEIIGYAYEADVHCINCTANRFNIVDSTLIKLEQLPVDSEGNTISIISLQEEFELMPYCGTCHQIIDEDANVIG